MKRKAKKTTLCTKHVYTHTHTHTHKRLKLTECHMHTVCARVWAYLCFHHRLRCFPLLVFWY